MNEMAVEVLSIQRVKLLWEVWIQGIIGKECTTDLAAPVRTPSAMDERENEESGGRPLLRPLTLARPLVVACGGTLFDQLRRFLAVKLVVLVRTLFEVLNVVGILLGLHCDRLVVSSGCSMAGSKDSLK